MIKLFGEPGKWWRTHSIATNCRVQNQHSAIRSVASADLRAVVRGGEKPHVSTTSCMYDPKTKDIINCHDLYNVGSTGAPFKKNLDLVGLDGALVLIKEVFNRSAMVNIIDSGLFKQIRHRLSPVRPSSKVLRVANGTLVPSEGLWVGRIIVDSVSTGGLFKIFPSGGSWEMLFGKPMLQAFSATHNFVNDSVTLEAEGLQTIIHNENATQNAERLRKFKVANASVSGGTLQCFSLEAEASSQY